MNNTLHRFCFAIWMLGFAGMWITKGVRLLGELPFEICARLSLVGGLSLCFLIAVDLLVRTRRVS